MNKYRAVRVGMTSGASQEALPLIGFSGGFRGDGPSGDLPLDSAAQVDNIRLDRRRIRKDFGFSDLGSAAPGLITFLGAYKLITESEVIERTIRVYRRGDGYGVIEFLGEDDWEELGVSDRIISGNRLSAVNIHNVMVFADGFGLLLANIEGDFEVIGGSPQASHIFPFGDRIVALQDGHDKQVMSWCISGDVTDWAGVGSGSNALINPRIDAIDDLMCGAPLGSNIAVIVRKRSILRVFLTGDPTFAIGATPWLEGVGTEAPFSIQVVPGGVVFLAHNLTPMFITESGPAAIGTVIRDDLVDRVGERASLSDSAFDPRYGEYWLGVADDPAEDHLTAAWIFDMKTFGEFQQLNWRRKPIEAVRLGIAGGTVAIVPAAPEVISATWERTESDVQRVAVVVSPHPEHTGDVLQLVYDGAVIDQVAGPHTPEITLYHENPTLAEDHEYTVRHTSVGEQTDPVTVYAGLLPPTGLAVPSEDITLCGYKVTFTTADVSYGLIIEDNYPDGGAFAQRNSVEITHLEQITVSHGASSEPCIKVLVDFRVRHWRELFGVIDYSVYVDGPESVQLCGDCS